MRAPTSHRGWPSRILRWLAVGLWRFFQALLIAWAALAIYYSNLPWSELRLAFAVVFAAFAIWGAWLSRRRHMAVGVAILFLAVVAWWIAIPPSHDRNWRPEVSR